jgi:hypothetical protein
MESSCRDNGLREVESNHAAMRFTLNKQRDAAKRGVGRQCQLVPASAFAYDFVALHQ